MRSWTHPRSRQQYYRRKSTLRIYAVSHATINSSCNTLSNIERYMFMWSSVGSWYLCMFQCLFNVVTLFNNLYIYRFLSASFKLATPEDVIWFWEVLIFLYWIRSPKLQMGKKLSTKWKSWLSYTGIYMSIYTSLYSATKKQIPLSKSGEPYRLWGASIYKWQWILCIQTNIT